MPPSAGKKEYVSPHFPPGAGFGEEEETEEMPRKGRPCYEFNSVLPRRDDDTACEHCRYYLTPRCPHLDEFMEDLEEMSPDG